jgi:hypothetical protein
LATVDVNHLERSACCHMLLNHPRLASEPELPVC